MPEDLSSNSSKGNTCFQEMLPFFVGLILCTEAEGPHLRLGGPEDKAMFPQGAGHVFNLVTMEMCHPYC